MDAIFIRESEKYLMLLEKYLNDKTNLHEVVMQARRVDLVQRIGDDGFLNSLKQRVFAFAKEEYGCLMNLDRKIKECNDRAVVEVDLDVFFAQAARVSCVREPPYGYERSPVFKPPYPTQEMMNWCSENKNSG